MEQKKRISCLGIGVAADRGLAQPFSRQFVITRNTIACRIEPPELHLRGADTAFGRTLEPLDRGLHMTFDAGAVEIEHGDVERGGRVTVLGRALEPLERPLRAPGAQHQQYGEQRAAQQT